MSIKYSEGHNFLKFYGTQTLKQALIDKNLIGPANIDEYFAMFLQGYVDEYDEKTDVFGEKNIQEVLAETKKKIDDYDNYNIKHAISQLYGSSPPPPYKVYKLYKDMKKHTSNLNLTAPSESKDTFIDNLRIIEESIDIIGVINDKITIEDINKRLKSKIVFFNEKIRASLGDTKRKYQKYKGDDTLKDNLEELLNDSDGFVAILNTYQKYTIDLFIKIHQKFYNYLDEYFGNKEWQKQENSNEDILGIWMQHQNYDNFWLVVSYVNYVEHIGNSINRDFLNIHPPNQTSQSKMTLHKKPFTNIYKITKDDIDEINEKVLFYLKLDEQIRKIINIYQKIIGQDYKTSIYDTSNKTENIDNSYNDITIKNIIEINIKSILRLLSSDQFDDLKQVVYSSIDTKMLFKAYRHFLKNIVDEDGYCILDYQVESMQKYKKIFIENVNKGDGESYTDY
jgi:hypothetical protein